MHNKTITQLPAAASADPNAVVAADNAAGTATEKVAIQKIVDLVTSQKLAGFLPPAIDDLAGTAGDTEVTLTWTAPTVLDQTPITDYEVEFSDDNGDTWTPFADGVSSSTGATVTGLTNDTEYLFRVRGGNAIGVGPWAISAGVTPVLPPAASILLHCDGSNASTSFPDSSGNNLSVTANGDAQVSTAQDKFGGASAYFDGSGDYLSVPDDPLLNFGSGSATIEFWMRPDSTEASFAGAAQKAYNPGGPGEGWAIFRYAAGLRVYLNAGDSGMSPDGCLTAGQWSHIALVKDGSDWALYVDGVPSGTATGPSFTDSSNPLSIGSVNTATGWNMNYEFAGFIDEFRIVKDKVYTGAFTPPAAPFA